MDAIDYARDNRLRLWFLGIDDYRPIERQETRKISDFEEAMERALGTMSFALKPGGSCVLVVGDLRRDGRRYDVPAMIADIARRSARYLTLHDCAAISPPSQRRSYGGGATKRETIMVFKRANGGYRG
jgi:hypothetical protein